MAIERGGIPISTLSGIIVASPDAHHGSHTFRMAGNFNRIVDGLIKVASDHSGDIGGIKYIKEWWEDPAQIGELEEFPCLYILPLWPESTKITKDSPVKSSPFIGDPLSMSTFFISLFCYYKYEDIHMPLREVRNYGMNFYDILSADKLECMIPGGLQMMIPDVGWLMGGTNWIVQWWTMRLKISAIL